MRTRSIAVSLGMIVALLIACTAPTDPTRPPAGPNASAGPVLAEPVFWVAAPIDGDPSPIRAHVPQTGAVVEGSSARILRPTTVPAARRVAIQAGHWKAEDAPAEFPHLAEQGGASFGGIDEVDVNLGVAMRVAALLRAGGIEVDVLPATVPPSYLADAFVALHADSDGYGDARGYKAASGFYRGPYEPELVRLLSQEYARATGLPWDDHVSDEMTDYYAFAWYRYQHALAPHTPAAILEMGFISNDEDRAVLLDEPSKVAAGIANGIVRFLDAEPRSAIFGRDIVVTAVPAPPPAPSATPLPRDP